MIDRYSITASATTLSERFSVDVPEFYKPHYNASPTHLLPVITSTTPQGLSLFYWGTAPEWAKNKTVSEKLINLPADVVPDKPSLRKALRTRRCIVPADGFYAWKKVGKKTSIPFRFVLKSRALFAIPGIWEEFEDTEGVEIQTFAIITVPASPVVSPIQERMPLLLPAEAEKLWLDQETPEDRLLALLNARSDQELDHYPVSPRISQRDIDVPSLIAPTPPADQFGNLTLFD